MHTSWRKQTPPNPPPTASKYKGLQKVTTSLLTTTTRKYPCNTADLSEVQVAIIQPFLKRKLQLQIKAVNHRGHQTRDLKPKQPTKLTIYQIKAPNPYKHYLIATNPHSNPLKEQSYQGNITNQKMWPAT
eukprot:gene3450-2401_t